MTQSLAAIVKEATQELWGVPDCEHCTAQEGCIIMAIWGLAGDGRPDVEGCSQYEPEKAA